jgi:hypothetical protein
MTPSHSKAASGLENNGFFSVTLGVSSLLKFIIE